MEKSLAATDAKVCHHIYDDIALVILSKLSLKSLKRFSFACKSWSLLFQNPYFMTMFRTNLSSKDHSYYNDTSILLQHSCESYIYHGPKLYSLFGENFENMNKLDWPNPYEDPFDFNIHGSVNGILCIQDRGRREGIRCIEELGRYVLWNPATREFQIAPTSPFAFKSGWDPMIDFHGFGYDRIRDDYKVIRHVYFFPRIDYEYEIWRDGNGSPLWEIYCLRSNSWKKLYIDMPRHYYRMGDLMYMDGVCHWWASDTEDVVYEINDEVYLVSFDLSCEIFVKTYIPSNMDDIDGTGTRMIRGLVVLNGTISCISYYLKATTFHISILGEIGVKESWTKLFTVGPLSCVEHPIGIGKKGDIFFRKNDDKLVWFNLNTQRIEELGIKGAYGCEIMVYKESLLPFPKINN
ncbi:putative F-box protein At3g16210 [Vicia villosa]|uniref:putative F-box protein At3g16210 n=1 Tax=Vicia villosa TaxID=3911 RepID=UPI00273C0883|nr:putative F-box protein At3g16210 [Vicia villosa]